MGGGLLILGVFLIIGLYIALHTGIISIKYTPALYILPFLIVAQVIGGMCLLSSNFMVYFEKTHFSLFIGLAISVVGLVASYFLVPIWGVFGAAIGYLVVQVAHLFLFQAAIKYQLTKLKMP